MLFCLLPETLSQADPVREKTSTFQSIFARTASAVTPGEKSFIISVIRIPIRAFQAASDEHRMLPLSPQRGLKNAKRPVSV